MFPDFKKFTLLKNVATTATSNTVESGVTAWDDKLKADAYDVGYLNSLCDMAQHLWLINNQDGAAEILGQADDFDDVYSLVATEKRFKEEFRQFVFETYE